MLATGRQYLTSHGGRGLLGSGHTVVVVELGPESTIIPSLSLYITSILRDLSQKPESTPIQTFARLTVLPSPPPPAPWLGPVASVFPCSPGQILNFRVISLLQFLLAGCDPATGLPAARRWQLPTRPSLSLHAKCHDFIVLNVHG